MFSNALLVASRFFSESRAILSGERELFANTKAYLAGKGTLFADTKAILLGYRPLENNYFYRTILQLSTPFRATVSENGNALDSFILDIS